LKKGIFIFLFGLIIAKSFASGDSNKIMFLTSKSELQFRVDNNTEIFTTHIRYKPNDSVWMSFTGLLGIEGARLLIDKDSVYIHNKLEKTYFTTPIQEKNEWVPFGFTMEDWNVLLTNNAMLSDSEKKPMTTIEKKVNDSISKKFTFNKNNQLEKYEILNVFSNERCSISFSNFQKRKNEKLSYAYNKKIVFSSPGNSEIELTIKHLDFVLNQPKNMPFAKQR
jgi:hypothetical protein